MIGIRTVYKVLADVPIASNVVLATVGLLAPLPANQKTKFRAWIPISIGATGGVRLQAVLPAGATIVSSSIIHNTVAPAEVTAIQTSSAAITNALANAGNHWLEMEGYVENGATAGNLDIQIAQNTSDVLTLTVLKGGQLDVVTES